MSALILVLVVILISSMGDTDIDVELDSNIDIGAGILSRLVLVLTCASILSSTSIVTCVLIPILILK